MRLHPSRAYRWTGKAPACRRFKTGPRNSGAPQCWRNLNAARPCSGRRRSGSLSACQSVLTAASRSAPDGKIATPGSHSAVTGSASWNISSRRGCLQCRHAGHCRQDAVEPCTASCRGRCRRTREQVMEIARNTAGLVELAESAGGHPALGICPMPIDMEEGPMTRKTCSETHRVGDYLEVVPGIGRRRLDHTLPGTARIRVSKRLADTMFREYPEKFKTLLPELPATTG